MSSRDARLALVAVVCGMLAACGTSPTREQARRGISPGTSNGTQSSPDEIRDDVELPQSRRYRQQDDSTPDGAGIDIASLPEPVPKAEPRARYGNKSPYSVRGRTYYVLPTAAGYDERGIASYYGTKFHGYMTSDFEKYDMYAFSAASKVLPLPSYARVTNLENGKSVIVRINDRGPFAENRIIDLSYAAAVRIGIWPKGTGLVEVQGIDPARWNREPELPATVTAQAGGPPKLYLQVGAFGDPANAERLAQRLRGQDVGSVRVVDAQVGGRNLKRVQIGPLADVDTADRVTEKIEALGLPHAQVAVQ
ncbi:MAG TPA: septal ring lytic transglycosylase RlpA family protein [Rhodanobacteraceae bacterium]|nr:septal ring lytic transglycosylase RlpA family protein [Rhodanobacteraceae bacterium]